MSQSVKEDAILTSCDAYHVHNHCRKRVLKSKENQFKKKHNKELKKKLKKYKLRKDGNEDPEVLNVSEILVNSLKIKSPKSNNNLQVTSIFTECEVLKPSNYLFKMVRRRKNYTQIDTSQVSHLKHSNIDNVEDSLNLPETDGQNKKQMDAFKLMMESRNKSIGSNSPGKEKSCNDADFQEIIEKKELKARRLLRLQKMSEDKGVLKRKEIDAYRDKYVEQKMLKRAERLKNMIEKPDKKLDNLQKNISVDTLKNESGDIDNVVDNKTTSPSPKASTIKLCDIFNDSSAVTNKKKITNKFSDEDIVFLNKLSPSLRKKENMLCYFQKLHKDNDMLIEQGFDNDNDRLETNYECENKSIIKVKFTPKRKKKKIHKTTDTNVENSQNKTINNSIEAIIDVNDSRKRKRNIKVNTLDVSLENNDIKSNSNYEGRPKRNSKTPVKYKEDVHCFSSDEELHIFTPKKKKNKELNSNNLCLENSKECIKVKTDVLDKKPSKIVESEKNKQLPNKKVRNISRQCKNLDNSKKPKNLSKDNMAITEKNVKLAPIFVTKPQVSQEAMEAKRFFLKGSVPEKLKKKPIQHSGNSSVTDAFYPVVHVQQISECSTFNNVEARDWFNINVDEDYNVNKVNNNVLIHQFLIMPPSEHIHVPSLRQKPDKVLKHIKMDYPKFPVYRTYHLLKGKSKGEFKDCNYSELDNSVEIINNFNDVYNETPERLHWCDKYKPSTSKQIIGNFDSVKELKKWLESWTEKLIKAKNNSDMSDVSDFYWSDTDSRDTHKSSNNVLIITGKTGSGKTSAVYAVAAELAVKVIEVNASSKRNGKIMLQDLQEATQSHKVDRGKTADCPQKTQEELFANVKKRGRPKKLKEDIKKNKQCSTIIAESTIPITTSQESIRTGMSLILIDDADIVFEQDDGFTSAISQLIQSSKRPVILITSSLSCLHLQKFFQNGKIIHMRPLLPRMLGTWLDIMCLADVGTCFTGLGAKLLDMNKGDIRKTINYLQFYMNTIKVNQTEDAVLPQIKCNFDEESSSMSWTDSEGFSATSSEILSTSDLSVYKQLQNSFSESLDIFNIWWSLSSCFNVPNISNGNDTIENRDKSSNMKKIVDILDTISIIDSIDSLNSSRQSYIATRPWHTNENASLLELENVDGFNSAFSVNRDILDVLTESTISKTEKLLTFENTVNINYPSMSKQRERDVKVSRHATLSSYLNPSAVLDRRAAAMDYWPSCRTLCRFEKYKTETSNKRNNRFCHYLKSLNILCKNDFFDSLADSLS